jgi:hypothetical protein
MGSPRLAEPLCCLTAWSDATKENFAPDYWSSLYRWYEDEGYRNVAAYLTEADLAGFNAKAPPRTTVAFQAIVDANRAPEDAELADTLDEIAVGGRRVTALTIPMLVAAATGDFLSWLQDRKNRRVIPHRLESTGYVQVRNDASPCLASSRLEFSTRTGQPSCSLHDTA